MFLTSWSALGLCRFRAMAGRVLTLPPYTAYKGQPSVGGSGQVPVRLGSLLAIQMN